MQPLVHLNMALRQPCKAELSAMDDRQHDFTLHVVRNLIITYLAAGSALVFSQVMFGYDTSDDPLRTVLAIVSAVVAVTIMTTSFIVHYTEQLWNYRGRNVRGPGIPLSFHIMAFVLLISIYVLSGLFLAFYFVTVNK